MNWCAHRNHKQATRHRQKVLFCPSSIAQTLGATTATLLLGLGCLIGPAQAQISADGTVNTLVNSQDNAFTITGGTRSGTTLFHSFSEFSIPKGQAAYFNNGNTITHIINRVTGPTPSLIDGLIRANGSANLFLINPNGIQFGPNASLQLNGDFLASTADRILFDNGNFFSASSANPAPMLTINTPIGLQLGEAPGPIQIFGPGSFIVVDQLAGNVDDRNRPVGLAVTSGQNLALIGGDLVIEGGNLTAAPGTIDLGSVGAHEVVRLENSPAGRRFNYEGISRFQDIYLSQTAGVVATDSNQSQLRVQARNIRLTEGSALSISASTSTQVSGGDIIVRASESVSLQGAIPALPSVIAATLSPGSQGDGGRITIETGVLQLAGGGLINSATGSSGNAGDILIQADQIEVSGLNPVGPFPTSIGTSSLPFATGDSGNLIIQTDSLIVRDGGAISTNTFSSGQAGDLTINANRIEIKEFAQQGLISTGIYSTVSPTTAVGNGGDININTTVLTLTDGAQISASASGQGQAGDIRIRANTIELTGLSPVPVIDNALQEFQPSSILAVGFGEGSNAGAINIDAEQVILNDGALIAVSTLREGNAGDLRVKAPVLQLNNGTLQADISAGSGGNIAINSELLSLQDNSAIATNAIGTANGGNITIDTANVVALDNSDITANAFEGDGGNILINTEGLFGIAFRETTTPNSDITASSRFGVDGVVNIETPDVDPAQGLVALPTALADVSNRITQACETTAGQTSFAAIGRAGLPTDPRHPLQARLIWQDQRIWRGEQVRVPAVSVADVKIRQGQFIEVQGWQRDAQGRVSLVAQSATGNSGNPVSCLGG